MESSCIPCQTHNRNYGFVFQALEQSRARHYTNKKKLKKNVKDSIELMFHEENKCSTNPHLRKEDEQGNYKGYECKRRKFK